MIKYKSLQNYEVLTDPSFTNESITPLVKSQASLFTKNLSRKRSKKKAELCKGTLDLDIFRKKNWNNQTPKQSNNWKIKSQKLAAKLRPWQENALEAIVVAAIVMFGDEGVLWVTLVMVVGGG